MTATRKARRCARQLLRLCFVQGRLDDDRVRATAQRIASSRRRGALGMLMHFHRLVRLDSERNTVLVESAIPLAHSVREGNRAAISPRQLSGRGLAFWSDGRGDDRVLYVTTGYRLISLNAKTGQTIPSFGFTRGSPLAFSTRT